MTHPVICIKNLRTAFGSYVVHDKLFLKVNKGEICALVGGSGSGKSTLLKQMVGLAKVQHGSIEIMGHNIEKMTLREKDSYYHKIGFLFQEGALFGNLTALQNVALPMERLTKVPTPLAQELAFTKLQMVGLTARAAFLKPSELSGGMRKRVALARALALDPELLYLDEPTAGLDPEASEGFDRLILELKESLGLTVMMVTHDLSTINSIATSIGMIANKMITAGTLEDLLKDKDPAIRKYFHSKRAEEIFLTP